DAALGAVIEGKAERGAALLDHLAHRVRALACRAIFERHVLGRVLPFLGHIRIEFERPKPQLRFNLIAEFVERLEKPAQTDHAPRTGNVGDEVETDRLRHLAIELRAAIAEEAPGGAVAITEIEIEAVYEHALLGAIEA